MRQRLRRFIITFATICLIWTGATWTGFADLRIVQRQDGVQTETLFKNNRVLMHVDDNTSMLLNCTTEELTIIGPGRYWQGTVAGYQEEVGAIFGQTTDMFGELEDMDFGDLGDLGGLFGELFGGGNKAEETLVRVTKRGEETITGYATEHYIVETGNGNNWRVHEEIWISTALLNEFRAEARACEGIMDDLVSTFSSGLGMFGMDELEAVLASPDYKALLERGYPVRTKQTVSGLFGMVTEWKSEVVEVSKDPISEDNFVVPSGYQRVNSFFELLDT